MRGIMWEYLGPMADYVLFVLVALAVGGAVARWLRRHRPQVRVPRAFWLFLGAGVLAGFFYVEEAGRSPQQRLITLFEGIAPTYADELTRLGHAELVIETAESDPRYLEMIEALKRWQRLNPLISDIYTFRMREDGRVVLMVDAETDYDGDGVFTGEREARTRPGEVYEQAGEELRRAFAGERNFMTEPVTDRWGTWVSVQVPMYDATGRVEAVLGMDYRADLWRAESAERRQLALAYLAVVLLILLGSGTSLLVYRQELRARRAADARLDLYVQQMPLAYVEWGPDFRVVRWNPAAQRIFGFTAEEARGRLFWEFIVPVAARPDIEALSRRLWTSREPVRHSNDNLTKDGRMVRCEWHNTPLVDAQGALLGVASHAQDITERVRLEQNLRQAQKLESMGQLAGGVAHEFNNLLTPMLMQMGQIQATYAADARLLEMLRPVEDSIMQAAQLNQRILAVSRRQPDGLALGDLGQMVGMAVELLRLSLDRRIELELELEPSPPPALLSRGAIVQVVMNLALNARDALLARMATQATPGWTPRLVVKTGRAVPPADAPESLRAAPECLHLTIADNGEGMGADVQRKVFEPFFTTKAAGQGTGLGLAVVLSVVEGLGGHIELRSALGAGATFTVYLPVARPEDVPLFAPTRPAQTTSGPAGKGRSILLVDDNALIRETLGDALRRVGHRVVEAADGEAGWQALLEAAATTTPFDLLIADLNLPKLSGRELLARNRGHAKAALVLSGMLETRLEPGEYGVRRVLHKPIGLAELLAAIDEVTARTELGTKTA